jgi:hypothetical protein
MEADVGDVQPQKIFNDAILLANLKGVQTNLATLFYYARTAMTMHP